MIAYYNMLPTAQIKGYFLRTPPEDLFCSCPLLVVDSLTHLFSYCPKYAAAREEFLVKWLSKKSTTSDAQKLKLFLVITAKLAHLMQLNSTLLLFPVPKFSLAYSY